MNSHAHHDSHNMYNQVKITKRKHYGFHKGFYYEERLLDCGRFPPEFPTDMDLWYTDKPTHSREMDVVMADRVSWPGFLSPKQKGKNSAPPTGCDLSGMSF